MAGVFSFGGAYTAFAGERVADKSEVYFEITVVGTSAKVVALDAATGVEVTAIGPAMASLADLKAGARQTEVGHRPRSRNSLDIAVYGDHHAIAWRLPGDMLIRDSTPE